MTASSKSTEQLEQDANETVEAKMRTTLYMLSHVAVDPRGVADMRLDLAIGVVAFDFFKVRNPAPFFVLPVEGAELADISRRFEVNATGPMGGEATRILSLRHWSRAEAESAVPGASWRQLLEAIAADAETTTGVSDAVAENAGHVERPRA